MIKACIVDDEPQSVELLQMLLNKAKLEVQLVGTANGFKEGLKLVKKGGFDVLFLDIKMPRGSGFDLLDELAEIDFQVVFVTAYNQYAIKAFRYAAIDYLLKPLSESELKDTLERLEKSNPQDGRIQMLLENHKSTDKFQRLAISTVDGVYYYEVNTIVRCEAEGSYTCIFLDSGKSVLASKSLKEYESMLPAFFFRVHKSHLVNLKKVVRFETGDKPRLFLEDNSQVVVSRRRKQALSTRLSQT